MNDKIYITSEFPVLSVSWEDDWEDEYLEVFRKNPDIDAKDIIEDLQYDYNNFIIDLNEEYGDAFIYKIDDEDTMIAFNKKYNSLKDFLDVLTRIIRYLEHNIIPWEMRDLSFTRGKEVGIIRFDQEKKFIIVYYIHPEEEEFRRYKISIRK